MKDYKFLQEANDYKPHILEIHVGKGDKEETYSVLIYGKDKVSILGSLDQLGSSVVTDKLNKARKIGFKSEEETRNFLGIAIPKDLEDKLSEEEPKDREE